jgi:hypothetical protein
VAAVVAFVFSSLYYRPVLLGNVRRVVDPAVMIGAKPSGAKALVEFARTLVITFCSDRQFQSGRRLMADESFSGTILEPLGGTAQYLASRNSGTCPGDGR